MKKKLICFSMLLLLLQNLLPVSCFAAEVENEHSWTVTFRANKSLEVTDDDVENKQTFEDFLRSLQPSDGFHVRFNLRNEYGENVDWYMWDFVANSFETGTDVTGGGYTFILKYTHPDGSEENIYNNDRVGGENPRNNIEGLKEATDRVKGKYFYLDTIPTGQTGYVDLTIVLDGETQGNDYQTKFADLQMRFAVEIPGKTIVRTGDESNYLPLYIGMIAGGLVLLYFALDAVTDRIYFGKKRAGK